MTLSFSEYDKMIETFRSYNTPVFLPSLDEIAMFERDPERWLRFAIYLSEFDLLQNRYGTLSVTIIDTIFIFQPFYGG